MDQDGKTELRLSFDRDQAYRLGIAVSVVVLLQSVAVMIYTTLIFSVCFCAVTADMTLPSTVLVFLCRDPLDIYNMNIDFRKSGAVQSLEATMYITFSSVPQTSLHVSVDSPPSLLCPWSFVSGLWGVGL